MSFFCIKDNVLQYLLHCRPDKTQIFEENLSQDAYEYFTLIVFTTFGCLTALWRGFKLKRRTR